MDARGTALAFAAMARARGLFFSTGTSFSLAEGSLGQVNWSLHPSFHLFSFVSFPHCEFLLRARHCLSEFAPTHQVHTLYPLPAGHQVPSRQWAQAMGILSLTLCCPIETTRAWKQNYRRVRGSVHVWKAGQRCRRTALSWLCETCARLSPGPHACRETLCHRAAPQPCFRL